MKAKKTSEQQEALEQKETEAMPAYEQRGKKPCQYLSNRGQASPAST